MYITNFDTKISNLLNILRGKQGKVPIIDGIKSIPSLIREKIQRKKRQIPD